IEIVRQKAIYGAPDLVIEIRSAYDRPSDTLELESDYRLIGVREIVFIDPQERQVRALRKTPDGYAEETLSGGPLTLQMVPGFHIQADWLFTADRPNEVDVLLELLASAA